MNFYATLKKYLPTVFVLGIHLLGAPGQAEEKLIFLEEFPRGLDRIEVAANGEKIFAASGARYTVLNALGDRVDSMAASVNTREIIPLTLAPYAGWYLTAHAHSAGHIALVRPDGSVAKLLVRRGNNANALRGDGTGWTSPTGMALDEKRGLIFALDSTMAPSDRADPDWSRIAVFDMEGKFVRDINRWDGLKVARNAPEASTPLRTWYDDIEVDPKAGRVYVTARASRKLLAFDYEGKPLGEVPGRAGIAVFPDGRIAVGTPDAKAIQIYSDELQPLEVLRAGPQYGLERALGENSADLETDGAGRLYATVSDAGTAFVRWSADLETHEGVGPRHLRLKVEWSERALVAGQVWRLQASVSGRPEPSNAGPWQVLHRPADGSKLEWTALNSVYRNGYLEAQTRPELRGLHEVVVRFGAGPINRAKVIDDPHLMQTVAFRPEGVERSIAVIPTKGRRAYLQGEDIPLQLARRGADAVNVAVRLVLQQGGKALLEQTVQVGSNLATLVPGSLTRRLVPGEYQLTATTAGHESYGLNFYLGQAAPDSPLQRILYHEFSQSPATVGQADLVGTAERQRYIRDYVAAVARYGFTRETDRKGWNEHSWQRESTPVPLAHPGFAPAEHYGISGGGGWETEYYLDQATRHNHAYDTQLIGHCGPICFLPADLANKLPTLQRTAQYLGKFPSFYGFNYNDEMFFGGYDDSAETRANNLWLKQAEAGEFKGKTRTEIVERALNIMYDSFNAAVKQANPRARTTTTPMWQYPAVEGSYAPIIYKGMDESYSHFLSEGYSLPWYPAQSVELLRRPGKPLMGVFDNNYSPGGGDLYLKNFMQVVARGVQGVGVQHTEPLTSSGSTYSDPPGATAYAVANRIGKMYGAIFAESRPANEGFILYSYTQDLTEKRNFKGTPHWERTLELLGAGQMAGVPLGITFEEDIQAGRLLNSAGKPEAPLLFLVGQKVALPAPVQASIKEFIGAGGKVFTDAESAAYPGATQLPLKTHQLSEAYGAGYAADTTHPLFQPILEKLAADLRPLVQSALRYDMKTDDPWVGKNRLDGGQVQYMVLATETGPFPWEAGTVWSTGAMYNKGNFGAYLPRTTQFSFRHSAGVIYDVLENKIVQPVLSAGRATVEADLTTFPGRIYAVAPAALGAPRLWTSHARGEVEYAVRVQDASSKPMAARVPLRIRLVSGTQVALEIYRGTGADGTFKDTLALPLAPTAGGNWTLEVTELLGGAASAALLPPSALGDAILVRPRPAVDVQREAQLKSLLKAANGTVTLVTQNTKTLDEAQVDSLRAAFKRFGLEMEYSPTLPKEKISGLSVAAGWLDNRNQLGDLLAIGIRRGLFEEPISGLVPGPGRGLVSALYAPRMHEEHVLALLGGDAAGLSATLTEFERWLKTARGPAATAPVTSTTTAATLAAARATGTEVIGKPATAPTWPTLSQATGIKLDGISATPSGGRLVVSGRGYARNLALVEDNGNSGKVLSVQRVGQAQAVGSHFISGDGTKFGAAARTVTRFGAGLHMFDAQSGKRQVFGGFGDEGRQLLRFAASADGSVVVAPGPNGVVCWRREGNAWKEAWALDYWKEYAKLDWPVSNEDHRNPQFHAVIPQGADYALVLFGEKSPQGWIKPQYPAAVRLVALNLTDGKERWRFEVPVPKTLLFPTLYTSSNGKHVLLQVQMGSWGSESYRFYSLVNGKSVASWDAGSSPAAVAVANGNGNIVTSGADRIIQVRDATGTLLASHLWPRQSVSVAWDEAGEKLFVADDAGDIVALEKTGKELWRVSTGVVGAMSSQGERLWHAGWDGRLRAYDTAGKARWVLNLTTELNDKNPLALTVAASKYAAEELLVPRREPTTSKLVPQGENLLRNGIGTLKVGGTGGWMSNGIVDAKAEDLTNGVLDDVAKPWLNLDEVFWNSQAGRPVWAEVEFKTPRDVSSMTVYENPRFPDSFPTQAVVQVWNEAQKKWDTAAHGAFLEGSTNTYSLNLKAVSKLRYVPWGSYYRNFYTSEIEVR